MKRSNSPGSTLLTASTGRNAGDIAAWALFEPEHYRDSLHAARTTVLTRREPAVQPRFHLRRRDRWTEQIALHLVAVERAQGVGLRLGLHALGHHGQAEFVRQRDDAGNDGAVARAVDHAGHEGAVDLQRVQRQPGDVLQRRIAGPEVVDGDADAEPAQRGEP